MSRKPLTDEMLRILKGAHDGRLRARGPSLRWELDGEDRPVSRDRKLLIQRGYVEVKWHPGTKWDEGEYTATPTDLGRQALA